MSEEPHLNSRHRATAEKILSHPLGHNVQWHDVLSLLNAVGDVTLEHDGRYLVTIGSETETFEIPGHHDVDAQQIVDLRRMLSAIGISGGS